jgi:D-tyrosyl-tRNA(Tyr) deacylase
VIAVLQRVREARVVVAGETVGAIGAGLLVLVCAERGDTEAQADRLLAKMLKLRIFSDEAGKMNRSVQDVGGGLLLVSQFTLAADTSGGNRPSFTQAAAPGRGAAPVRLRGGPGARRAPRGADRPVCRRHEGAPGQRRAGDDSDARRAAGPRWRRCR